MKSLILFSALAISCVFSSCKKSTCDDGVLNQDEVEVDCGGPCSSCPITYEQNSSFGQNILWGMDTLNLNVGEYSYQARVPEGSSIKLELELIDGTEWFYSLSPENWTVSLYNNGIQSFENTNYGNCLLKFILEPSPDPMVPVGGSFFIHYHENGQYIGSKVIIWN